MNYTGWYNSTLGRFSFLSLSSYQLQQKKQINSWPWYRISHDSNRRLLRTPIYKKIIIVASKGAIYSVLCKKAVSNLSKGLLVFRLNHVANKQISSKRDVCLNHTDILLETWKHGRTLIRYGGKIVSISILDTWDVRVKLQNWDLVACI